MRSVGQSRFTWKPLFLLTSFFGLPSASLSSSLPTRFLLLRFFFSFFIMGLRFAPPPRVLRALLFSSACKRAAYAASASSTDRFFLCFFFGEGKSATSE